MCYSATWNFAGDQPNFIVINPTKTLKPDFLYKYYGVSNCLYKNSVNAFLNHYLFASHPLNLNDKFDCCADLIDYSSLSVEDFQLELPEKLSKFPKDKIPENYNSDKRHLENCLGAVHQQKQFMKIDIISLTKIPNDILIWSYYSQNSGFVLKLRTSLLPQEWSGPFPINYTEN